MAQNMTQSIQEKLRIVEEKLFDELIQLEEDEKEEINYLDAVQNYRIHKPSLHLDELMFMCKEYGIMVDKMSRAEMVDALMKLSPDARTVHYGTVEEKADQILCARDLLNRIIAYQKSDEKDHREGELLLETYECYLYIY